MNYLSKAWHSMERLNEKDREGLIKKAISGSEEAKDELFRLLCERFSRLSQYIFWEGNVTKEVVAAAMQNVRDRFAEWSRSRSKLDAKDNDKRHDEPFAKWTQRILDEEIERYFNKIVAEIKAGSRSAEAKLFTILDKRSTYLIKGLFLRYGVVVNEDDAEDIKQKALITISRKYLTATPHGTFIQWAQQILNYKFLDYLRVHIKNANRTADLAVVENEPDQQWLQIASIGKDELKKILLPLVARLKPECKRIFEFLLSGRDPKSIYGLFPNLRRGTIYSRVFRCRKELKQKLTEEGIFL